MCENEKLHIPNSWEKKFEELTKEFPQPTRSGNATDKDSNNKRNKLRDSLWIDPFHKTAD